MRKNRYISGEQFQGPGEVLLEKLRRLYGGQAMQRDIFGRRIALPSEIQNAIRRRGTPGR